MSNRHMLKAFWGIWKLNRKNRKRTDFGKREPIMMWLRLPGHKFGDAQLVLPLGCELDNATSMNDVTESVADGLRTLTRAHASSY